MVPESASKLFFATHFDVELLYTNTEPSPTASASTSFILFRKVAAAPDVPCIPCMPCGPATVVLTTLVFPPSDIFAVIAIYLETPGRIVTIPSTTLVLFAAASVNTKSQTYRPSSNAPVTVSVIANSITPSVAAVIVEVNAVDVDDEYVEKSDTTEEFKLKDSEDSKIDEDKK